MPRSRIRSIILFLKKKIDFSFLNAAGILFVAGVLLTSLHMKQVVRNDSATGRELFTGTSIYRDLNCIKPFTSLVGFNWKFSREVRKKTKEEKASSIRVPFVHL